MKNEKNKNNLGITLIALVITIIVLILLAGISLSMISGSDGLLSRAGKATEIQSNAQVSEAISLIYNEYITEQKTSGITDDFVNYVKSKGKINDSGVIDTKKLAGGKLALGNGKDTKDVYKLEKVADNYVVRYYGEKEDDEIKTVWSNTGNLADVEAKVEFTYEEIETESRAVALRIYATINNLKMVEENLPSEYVNITVSCDGKTEIVTNCAEYNKVTSGINIEDKDNGEVLVTCEFAMVSNGEYDVQINVGTIGTKKGKVKITKCKSEEEEKYSNICNSNTEITSDGYQVVVPAGFAYGISENVKSVNSGFVITDNVDDEGNSIGNEFVWIPINKENLTVGNTDKKMANLSSESNYEGVLYDYLYNWRTKDELKIEESKVLEPYETTKDQLMINSVKKYGGFYVARYETSIENGISISKLGYAPILEKMVQLEEENYKERLENEFNINYTNKFESVESDIMCESQYNAMLNFIMTTEKNVEKILHSDDWIFYYDDVVKTGLNRKEDFLNNIYDLGGNCVETLKTRENIARSSYTGVIVRGSLRENTRFSTRMSLYIK